jgi:NADP-dependent 3-hydroxy acid dehydrogenase YdfG
MNHPNSLQGRVAVITGASSGFGEAMTLEFARAGARLVLVARGKEALEKTAAEARKIGAEVETVAGDVTDGSTFGRTLQAALARYSRVDILINNAGGGVKIAPVDEQTPAEIESCLALNLTSAIHACRVFVPQMKIQKSGLIINIISACAHFAWPSWSVYSAAKAGLAMFSRGLYAEVRPHGIAVSNLVPGGANTSFQKNAGIDRFSWDESQSLRPEHLAKAALAIATMPSGGVVPEMVVYGQSQEIIPF